MLLDHFEAVRDNLLGVKAVKAVKDNLNCLDEIETVKLKWRGLGSLGERFLINHVSETEWGVTADRYRLIAWVSTVDAQELLGKPGGK